MTSAMATTRKISGSAKLVAKNLLSLNAIQFNIDTPFTWVSGIKSPVYCDNRVVNSDTKVRKEMVDAFVSLIQKEFPDVNIIAGVATGGIPMGVLIADRMNLPFIYVRQAKKEHGLMKQVEGAYKEGDKIVLIEDHISTGGSSLKAIEGIREAGLNLVALVSIMTYGFNKAENLFRENDINNWSLCDLEEIVNVAVESNQITASEKEVVMDFKNSQ